ncbi:pyridoxamine 5'-phosphate oxidase family protein [Saccharothrix algeriensis]|uniref:Nitroimidazol reductase NimA-like FMN-containing flavoprotein (Pyridoxamine 5'-phosphate oxidase superfamily) n=1 Tax=Saccharothrix algeriensis TaxID=173560 RepID=A0A8T8HV97_9PSEU|nr:pyridoxamine 5'-phosphate oxidase family protein [Saccharothrix algeriensis]MBM7813206.1 nitroimidazol reductase NimA-like FMN-containing flavoprotein (pyridoxamine 5'-phosphate oxidase superfamily) [Saccharothrix algeriensis]QTR01784.1 pyridoxamine 5'-phosphate oxidase family protein [Saccharothrix algeriensis]
MYDSVGLQVLSREECLGLLGATAVGRLVFTDRALPVVHPVVYALDGESVVLRVPDGSLTLVARDTIVAFQIDDIRPDLSTGWSVMAVGHVTEVDDEAGLSRLRDLPLPTRGVRGQDRYLVVALEVLTGRRIP